MMQFGCFASLALWLVVLSVLSQSVVPVAIGVIYAVGLWMYRGLRSEWPLF